MRFFRFAWWVVALSLGCHGGRRGPGVDSLVGLEAPLLPSPALRVVVAGAVGDVAAEVTFDPSSLVSFVAKACVPSPNLRAHVTVADPFGPDETFALARIEGFSVGALELAPFEAAVAGGEKCVVVLGGPELRGVALEVNPATRVLHVSASQSRESWLAKAAASDDDVQVLTVTKDPRNDWPLISVRITQGPTQFQGVFLVSLRDSRSRLYDESAKEAGLRAGIELLHGLPLPDGITLPPELSQLRGYTFDRFELAPGFGVAGGSVEIEAGAPPHAVNGLLGSDVWGRFHAVYDVGASLLVLRRPRVFVSGARAKCVMGNETSEEACFELHSRAIDGGVELTATSWAPLATGAQLALDVEGAQGSCRIGITFSAGDRGRSTHHQFPWPRLAQSVPGCADAFKGATAVTPGLLEDSPLRECAGVCAWARDAVTQRMSCECQPGVRTADGEAEQRLLQLFKKALEEQLKVHEAEPKDPD